MYTCMYADKMHSQHKIIIMHWNGWFPYILITLLSWLHVTWNHVQGFTRVGSQLCNTFPGSDKLFLNTCKASPACENTKASCKDENNTKKEKQGKPVKHKVKAIHLYIRNITWKRTMLKHSIKMQQTLDVLIILI